MRIRFEPFAFAIVIFFSILGVSFFSIILHELSHYQDMHEIILQDDICILNMPTTFDAVLTSAAGYYSYNYNYSNLTIRDKVDDTGVWTESKAYTISFLIMALFTVLMIVIVKRRVENNMKAKELDLLNNQSLPVNVSVPVS